MLFHSWLFLQQGWSCCAVSLLFSLFLGLSFCVRESAFSALAVFLCFVSCCGCFPVRSSGESALPLAHGWRLLEESTEKCKGRTGFDPGQLGRGHGKERSSGSILDSMSR